MQKQKQRQKQRLALDIGTNSIGWALLSLNEEGDPNGINKIGVRIFSDGRNPKDNSSLAVARRLARQMRRQRDRKNQRKKLILNVLRKMGLFPTDPKVQQELKQRNVLELRSVAKNKEQRLHPFDLGRCLFHLSKSRGFKSSRNETTKKRDTKISKAIEALKEQLNQKQALTFGEFLFQRMQNGDSTIATVENGFYPSRDIVMHEFDEIVKHQKHYHPAIQDTQWQRLKDVIFYQRPLRPPEVGKCTLFIEQDRAFQFMPSFEIYRFLGALYNLRWRDDGFQEHELSSSQINVCISLLKFKKEIKYTEIRKIAGLDKAIKFSIEAQTKREKIKGCPTISFMGDLKKGVLKSRWSQLSLKEQDSLSYTYFMTENSEDLGQRLASLKILSNEEVTMLCEAKMPNYANATCSFSVEALQEINRLSLTGLESPLTVLSKLRKEETLENVSAKLDYYGKAIPDSVVPIPPFIARFNSSIDKKERQYGKIANPTVHIVLNQIRLVVNEIIEHYGKPDEIHIEFARDLKLSKNQKIGISKAQKVNELINEKAKAFIAEHGIKDSAFHREKVKLWFEMETHLECHCIYSGKKISQAMVLSEQVEIDHILPFSQTLDNGFTNKVLVLVDAYRYKGNRTPFEAFGRDEEKWLGILERAKQLPEAKAWRFSENSMEIFLKNQSFLARHLTDTSYLSKTSKKYLRTVIPENKIVTSPGRLTALIRGKLGMNRLLGEDRGKNRKDYRRHAVNAVVIGITDRRLLNEMSKAAENKRLRIIVEPPWPNFHESLKNALAEVVVSHRVDHGSNVAFVEQTGFGLRKPVTLNQIENDFKLVIRKPIELVTDANKIVGRELKEEALRNGISSLKAKGIKKLRIYDVCKEEFESIGSKESYLVKVEHGESGRHYVCYKKAGAFKMCIWKVPVAKDSKEAKKGDTHRLEYTYVYYFDAAILKKHPNRFNDTKPHPGAKLLMTLHKGDTVALEKNGKLGYFQVKSLKPSSTQTMFLEINLQETPEGMSEFLLSASKLKAAKLRKVKVTPDGRVFDGGPRL